MSETLTHAVRSDVTPVLQLRRHSFANSILFIYFLLFRRLLHLDHNHTTFLLAYVLVESFSFVGIIMLL